MVMVSGGWSSASFSYVFLSHSFLVSLHAGFPLQTPPSSPPFLGICIIVIMQAITTHINTNIYPDKNT